MEGVKNLYIYPDNLKAAPTLWLWRLQDMAVGGLLAVLGVALLMQFGSFLFAAIAALYLFLTIRFDDVCILDFIRKAGIYFLFQAQSFRWASCEKGVTDHTQKKKIHTQSHEHQSHQRAQHHQRKRR